MDCIVILNSLSMEAAVKLSLAELMYDCLATKPTPEDTMTTVVRMITAVAVLFEVLMLHTARTPRQITKQHTRVLQGIPGMRRRIVPGINNTAAKVRTHTST